MPWTPKKYEYKYYQEKTTFIHFTEEINKKDYTSEELRPIIAEIDKKINATLSEFFTKCNELISYNGGFNANETPVKIMHSYEKESITAENIEKIQNINRKNLEKILNSIKQKGNVHVVINIMGVSKEEREIHDYELPEEFLEENEE